MKQGRVAAAAGACCAALALPQAARADNMGGLVYIVFIWPVGGLCFVLLAVLCVISALKYRKGKGAIRSSLLPRIFLSVSAAAAAVYPFLVVMLDGAYQARAPIGVMLLSILPVEAIALAVFILNLAMVRVGKAAR